MPTWWCDWWVGRWMCIIVEIENRRWTSVSLRGDDVGFGSCQGWCLEVNLVVVPTWSGSRWFSSHGRRAKTFAINERVGGERSSARYAMKQDKLRVEPYPWLHIQWEDGDAKVVVVCVFWAVGCFSSASVAVVVVVGLLSRCWWRCLGGKKARSSPHTLTTTKMEILDIGTMGLYRTSNDNLID